MIRFIYTFFVGLFLAIFIGLGIDVFYEAPKAPTEPSWYGSSVQKKELSPVEQKQENSYQAARKSYDKKMNVYNRNVSIIVLASSVVILVIALLFADKLGIVADGILLGGIFTLAYGIGRGMVTDSNKYRFLVAAVGLVITLLLGYIQFTRHELKAKSRKIEIT